MIDSVLFWRERSGPKTPRNTLRIFCSFNLAAAPFSCQNTHEIDRANRNPTMNPTDCPSKPVSTSNEITRRSFMKKSALTVGSITLLAQGIGLAINTSDCSRKVKANPDALVHYSNIQSFGGYGIKVKVVTTPSGGAASTKQVEMQAVAWDEGNSSTVLTSDKMTVYGTVLHTAYHAVCSLYSYYDDGPGVIELPIGSSSTSVSNLVSEVVESLVETFAILRATDAKATSTEAYVKAEAYIKTVYTVNTYRIIDVLTQTIDPTPTSTTTTTSDGSTAPDCIKQNIWVWLV